MSKKKNSKKPREEWIYATTKDEITSLEISVSPGANTISFDQSMTDIYSQISHKREDKPDKVIHRTYQEDNNVCFDSSRALLDCDKILFIDTNQKEIIKFHISVTAISILNENIISPLAYIARFSKDKYEERQFWYYAFRCLIAHNFITTSEKINVVVDAHLDNILTINSRFEPLCKNIFLPQNITLHYASADKGKEYGINRAIIETDKIATNALNQFIKKIPDFISVDSCQEVVYFRSKNKKLQMVPLNMFYSSPPWD